MRRFILIFLLSTFSAMAADQPNSAMRQLTDHLGKTVLYGDIAISPDGTQLAWVQSTATSPVKQTNLRAVAGTGPAVMVKLPEGPNREDFDPAWSPDSKTLVVFSTAGDKDGQRQLWSVAANGSNPKKLTQLKGYAARP